MQPGRPRMLPEYRKVITSTTLTRGELENVRLSGVPMNRLIEHGLRHVEWCVGRESALDDLLKRVQRLQEIIESKNQEIERLERQNVLEVP